MTWVRRIWRIGVYGLQTDENLGLRLCSRVVYPHMILHYLESAAPFFLFSLIIDDGAGFLIWVKNRKAH